MRTGPRTASVSWPPGATVALVLACILWAASSIAAKVALGDGSAAANGTMGPFTLAAVRFGVGGAVLYAFLRIRGHWMPVRPEDRGRFLLLGGLGIGLTYMVFYGGMRFTTATETTLLVAAEPVLIALLARMILRERLTPLQGSGLAVGVAGVYLIVVRGLVPRAEGTVLANAVVAVSLVFESYSSIVGKRLTSTYPGLVVAATGMLLGAAMLAPFAVHEALSRGMSTLGAAQWSAVAYLTLVCSCLCYGVWYSLLRRYPVSKMAAFLFIQPLLGPVYGYVLLGETMTMWTVAGAVLVVAGVWMVAAPSAARRGAARA